MTREEEITEKAREMYRAEAQNSLQFRTGFCTGAKWADQHPRKGLWDAEKVCKVLKDYMFKERFFDNRITRTAMIDNVVCNLIKAMED